MSPSGIGIPHYVLDYEDRFRESVIDNFADSYALGETPVPCIECNRAIKFRDLLDDRARARRRRRWPPATMSPRAVSPTDRARCFAPPTPIATRAISCLRPRASSSTICAFRSAT